MNFSIIVIYFYSKTRSSRNLHQRHIDFISSFSYIICKGMSQWTTFRIWVTGVRLSFPFPCIDFSGASLQYLLGLIGSNVLDNRFAHFPCRAGFPCPFLTCLACRTIYCGAFFSWGEPPSLTCRQCARLPSLNAHARFSPGRPRR